jgi:solute carrier family 8 (sodium/calcium exchanger)
LYWKKYQEKMMAKLKATGQPLVIAGDGRHDSMGHSAKYCAYTLFCCTVPLIIDFSLVQVDIDTFYVLYTVAFPSGK